MTPHEHTLSIAALLLTALFILGLLCGDTLTHWKDYMP